MKVADGFPAHDYVICQCYTCHGHGYTRCYECGERRSDHLAPSDRSSEPPR